MTATADVKVKKEKKPPPDVPLHEKVAITYEEAEALGLGQERTLRKLKASGKLRRCVLHFGRSVKFHRELLIAELQQPKKAREN